MKMVLPAEIAKYVADSSGVDYQLGPEDEGFLKLPEWGAKLATSEACELMCEVTGLQLDMRQVQLAVVEEPSMSVTSDTDCLTKLDEVLSRIVIGIAIRALSMATDEIPEDAALQGVHKGVAITIAIKAVDSDDVRMMRELAEEALKDTENEIDQGSPDFESGQFQVAWQRIHPYRENAFNIKGLPVAKVTNTMCSAIIATLPLCIKIHAARKKGRIDPTPVFLSTLAKSLRVYFLREEI
jgi:hypothetical protein